MPRLPRGTPNLWLSPCYEQGLRDHSLYLETGVNRVRTLLPIIEKESDPFKARPR